MAKSQVLRFWIHLTDKALVDTLNTELDAGGGATVNPHGSVLVAGNGLENGLYVAPYAPPDGGAAATANALLGLSGVAPVIETGDAMASPSVSSEWFTGGANFPLDVRTFTRKSGGWFGIPLLFGDTTNFYWSGRFVYTPADDEVVDGDGEVVVTPATMPTTYFLETFEMPSITGAGGNGGTVGSFKRTRDASGFTDGLGMGFRKEATVSMTHLSYENIAGGLTNAPKKVWERIYYTPRALPVIAQSIWAAFGTPTTSHGWGLTILPTGQLALYVRDLSSGAVLIGTTTDPVVLHEKIRIDLLHIWAANTTGGDARIRLYINGVVAVDSGLIGIGPGTSGTAAGHKLQYCELNQQVAGLSGVADSAYEADIHYWHAKAIPNIAGVESLNSVDWLNGSRGVFLEVTGEDAVFADWTPDLWRTVSDRPLARTNVQLSSTTSEAIAAFETDIVSKINGIKGAVGIGSFIIGMFSYRGSTGSGDIGYDIDGAGMDWAAVVQAASPSPTWTSRLYPGPGTALALKPESLSIGHRKAADTSSGGLQYLQVAVELIGIFANCDVLPDEDGETPDVTFPSVAGVHNSAYPTSPWANPGPGVPTFGPLHIATGTFTGNGTGQDIPVKAAPVFVHIRRVTGTSDLGAWWHTAMLGAHTDIERGIDPVVRCLKDESFAAAGAEDEQEQQYLIRISLDAMVNTNAASYRYFIVCDPAARFHLAHASIHSDGGTLPRTEPLPVADYTPTFALLWPESLDNTTTEILQLKDSNVVTVNASLFTGQTAETANTYTFGVGEVTHRLGILTAAWPQIAQLLMRLDDGNGPFDIPPFAVVSFVGDGSASRTIGVDLGGKRPLWAIGSGGSIGFQRDPGHTSTNSNRLDNGSVSTAGFTGGGIDSISVGTSMNGNGLPIVILVYPGSATAGNNGWSIDGEFWPIEPDSPRPADWEEPEEIDNGGGGSGSSGDSGSGDALVDEPDLDQDTIIGSGSVNVGGLLGGQVCEVYTRHILNIALSRIGQSKVVTDIVAQNTEAAIMARRHIKEAVNATLRAFPWPFCTRYAELVVIDGALSDPVNNDWIYAYRAPNSMMMARRITVAGKGRRPDPNSPEVPFRLTTDATGLVLYCNVEATDELPLVLEYSVRINCPSFYGDALFRDALGWRFAAELAGPLARDRQRAEECMAMFRQLTEPQARTVAANESQQERDADADWISNRG